MERRLALVGLTASRLRLSAVAGRTACPTQPHARPICHVVKVHLATVVSRHATDDGAGPCGRGIEIATRW
jgi:hypothetical protein